MSRPNLSLLYYRHYFSGIDWNNPKSDATAKKIKEENAKLLEQQLIPEHYYDLPNVLKFRLGTTYPGLLTGSGIPHEAGAEGEFKLGIHFDFTSGAPVIFGSSIKGVLSSVFKIDESGNDQSGYNYVRSLLPDKGTPWTDIMIKDVYYEIFEGKDSMHDGKLVSKPLYSRDIFFDALPVDTLDQKRRILAPDALAPHGNNPLKDPIPIPFIKVRSQVVFEFRFKLNKSNLLSAQEKLEFFRKILLELGAGAKTNVGYGQFNEVP